MQTARLRHIRKLTSAQTAGLVLSLNPNSLAGTL
jgi:hypothetical protein